jgi:hypothetical protein
VVAGGHDRDGIQAEHGCRGAFGDDGVDPFRAIRADVGQRRRSVCAEVVDELAQGL